MPVSPETLRAWRAELESLKKQLAQYESGSLRTEELRDGQWVSTSDYWIEHLRRVIATYDKVISFVEKDVQ